MYNGQPRKLKMDASLRVNLEFFSLLKAWQPVTWWITMNVEMAATRWNF